MLDSLKHFVSGIGFVYIFPAILFLVLTSPAEGQMHHEDEDNTLIVAADNSKLKDEEILNMAPRLSIKELTDLIEVYLRMDNMDIAKRLAEHILSRDPENEIALGVINPNRLGHDRSAPDDDNSTDSGDDRVYAEIEALMAARKYDKVITKLKAMKADQYYGSHFPYQFDLADALYEKKELHEAEKGFAEILGDRGYDEEERTDAYHAHHEISKLLKSGVNVEGEWETQKEGDAYRSMVNVKSSLFAGDWRFGVRGRRDDIRLNSEERSIRRRGKKLHEAEGYIEKYFSNDVFVSLSAGRSENDMLWGGRFEQTISSGITWGACVAINQRTDDSLQLTTLDGRQNLISLSLSMPLTSRLNLDADIFKRQVKISSDRIGSGYGGDVNLGYTLIEQKLNKPSFTLFYMGEVNIFDHSSISHRRFNSIAREDVSRHDLMTDLIESRVNRHGPGFAIEGIIGKGASYELISAILYDFDDAELQYVGDAGINVILTKCIDLYVCFTYESGGRAANNNSHVSTLNSGLDISF
jgi:hypothetical protein